MGKAFNVNADCQSGLHYMVNLESRLAEIKGMIDRGDYFTINRARQYGKTTILKALKRYLSGYYIVLSLDFQKLSHNDFETEGSFVKAISREILKKSDLTEKMRPEIQESLKLFVQRESSQNGLADLFFCFCQWCKTADQPVVLMIDEVDSATNNQVFLDFLAQLRGCYMERDEIATFQSVILAGVYDIKNLREKLTGEEHKVNSPWNARESNEPDRSWLPSGDCSRYQMVLYPFDIAADFLVEMSFSIPDIAGMLAEYEMDYQTGMDIEAISALIYEYTSGYPYLVSRICKLLDERIAGSEVYPDRTAAWTRDGVLEAVKLLLTEPNTLFESLINKLEDYPELSELLQGLLLKGKEIVYVVGVRSIETALMFGFVKKTGNQILMANRIFETLLYNLFLASPKMQQESMYDVALREKNQFVQNNHLNMKLVLEKFVLHFTDLYGDRQESFLEEDGRKYFLLYLRPIINGTGNYYIEAQTRNMERTDVIVDYQGEQFVIELKIWRGNSYHERGERQLLEYLEYYHLKKGYMLSFNFNQKKQTGVRELALGDKTLIEAVV